MMDDLIKRIVDKTGIPADKARTAAETVIGFIKTKLPGPVSGQIDSVVKGDHGDDITSGIKNTLK